VATTDLSTLPVENAEDADRPFLEEAFAGRAELIYERWDDPDAAWPAYDLVVLRSTWDYARRLPEFLGWVDRTAAAVTLLNGPRTVHWNCDKRYLGDLERAGVPVVPTRYATTPDDAVAALRGAGGGREVVVKPSVSAGSHLTGRFAADDPAAAALAADITAAGKTVMVQPFVPSVAEQGEVAVLFVDGRPSHAVRKGPLLAPGGGFLAGTYVEDVRPAEPTRLQLETATAAMRAYAAIHPGAELLYARVDLVEPGPDRLQVLELELIEPSLFLPYAPGAAARFAEATLRRCS
jgi:glutathione synthase/RimK-type ligase-like ATP-grasp enzyme